MDSQGLSCTLAGPELLERIQDWRKVAARAKSRSLKDNAVVSVYPRDPALLGELRRLIDAEKDCCSFMEFRIEETADEAVVHLHVPEEMQHVLGMMIGLATGEEKVSAEAS